jgi:hypothetical protein
LGKSPNGFLPLIVSHPVNDRLNVLAICHESCSRKAQQNAN